MIGSSLTLASPTMPCFELKHENCANLGLAEVSVVGLVLQINCLQGAPGIKLMCSSISFYGIYYISVLLHLFFVRKMDDSYDDNDSHGQDVVVGEETLSLGAAVHHVREVTDWGQKSL